MFGAPVLKTMQFDGKQYGVPTDLSLHFLYYRKDLIDALLADPAAQAKYTEIAQEKLGQPLKPKDPDSWTWDDFAATALYFTKAVNPDSPTRYGTVLQMKNLLFNMMVFQSLPRSYGADWMDADGKVTVDSDAYRKGLELYKMLTDAGATPAELALLRICRGQCRLWLGPGGDDGAVERRGGRAAEPRDLAGRRRGHRDDRAARRPGGPLHPYPRARVRAERQGGEPGGRARPS